MFDKICKIFFWPILITLFIASKEYQFTNIWNITIFISWLAAAIGILALFSSDLIEKGFTVLDRMSYTSSILFCVAVLYYGHFVLGAFLVISWVGLMVKKQGEL